MEQQDTDAHGSCLWTALTITGSLRYVELLFEELESDEVPEGEPKRSDQSGNLKGSSEIPVEIIDDTDDDDDEDPDRLVIDETLTEENANGSSEIEQHQQRRGTVIRTCEKVTPIAVKGEPTGPQFPECSRSVVREIPSVITFSQIQPALRSVQEVFEAHMQEGRIPAPYHQNMARPFEAKIRTPSAQRQRNDNTYAARQCRAKQRYKEQLERERRLFEQVRYQKLKLLNAALITYANVLRKVVGKEDPNDLEGFARIEKPYTLRPMPPHFRLSRND